LRAIGPVAARLYCRLFHQVDDDLCLRACVVPNLAQQEFVQDDD